jgi:hypothetical protein
MPKQKIIDLKLLLNSKFMDIMMSLYFINIKRSNKTIPLKIKEIQ